MVGTGFERNVSRRAAQVAGSITQRVDLGMRLSGPAVPAAAQELLVPGYDTTDPGVGVGGETAPVRQFQGAGHA